MKSVVKIAVEALIVVSLIALFSLLIALVYGLLSLLSPAPSQAATPAEIPVIIIHALPPAIELLSFVKDSPELIATTNYEAMTTRQLRPLAKDKKIARWNRLTKKELIAALNAI